jgi:hypothetical protein
VAARAGYPPSPGEVTALARTLLEAEEPPDPLGAARAADLCRQTEQGELALRIVQRAYDHQHKDDPTYNSPLLLLRHVETQAARGVPGYPIALETLYALSSTLPEVRGLYDVLQAVYGAQVKRGGQQAFDEG